MIDDTGIIEVPLGENTITNEVSFASVYKRMQQEERKLPDYDAKVRVGKAISEQDLEFESLVKSGVSVEDIKSGRITRSKLLAAGYVFNNYPVVQMEKPLINVFVNGVDYSKKKLLTQEELNSIIIFQRSNPDQYGTEQVGTDAFRQDMLSFVYSSAVDIPNDFRHKSQMISMALRRMDSPNVGMNDRGDRFANDPHGLELAKLYQRLCEVYVKSHKPSFAAYEQFTDENFGDLMPWDGPSNKIGVNAVSRGFETRSIPERIVTATRDDDSPFLDSGFKMTLMGGNPDVEVKIDEDTVIRVNLMVIHLLSRGVSEMGGADDAADQRYDIGSYEKFLYNSDPVRRQQIQDNEESKFNIVSSMDDRTLLLQLMERLKQKAVEWANSNSELDLDTRKVLEMVKKYESNKINLLDRRAARLLVKN